jgi:hypothetical protein
MVSSVWRPRRSVYLGSVTSLLLKLLENHEAKSAANTTTAYQ